MRRNERVIKNDKDHLVVKDYPKNKNEQPINQKQLPKCPSCKRNMWLEVDKAYFRKNSLSTKKNNRLIEKTSDKITIFQLD